MWSSDGARVTGEDFPVPIDRASLREELGMPRQAKAWHPTFGWNPKKDFTTEKTEDTEKRSEEGSGDSLSVLQGART